MPANGGSLSFWTSYDTEPEWDHLFVEARTAGGDDWTTLPDVNGHTSTATGQSCAAGWVDLHPQLAHYQTWDGKDSCTATGTTGAWNAATGNSSGWQQWRSTCRRGPARPSRCPSPTPATGRHRESGSSWTTSPCRTAPPTSFETGLDGWAVSGAPAGSAPNSNDWIATDASGFPVGASITTPDTILMGFGVEGITFKDQQAAVLGAAMKHLLP